MLVVFKVGSKPEPTFRPEKIMDYVQ